MVAGEQLGLDEAGPVTVVLADLARDTVAVVAPMELGLMADATVRWESGRLGGRRHWSWTGGSVESGMTPTVFSDIVYPLLTGTFTQLLGAGVLVGSRRWWMRRRAPQIPPQTQFTLDREQRRRFEAACVAYGMTLGLSRGDAKLFAAAAYGALCQAHQRP